MSWTRWIAPSLILVALALLFDLWRRASASGGSDPLGWMFTALVLLVAGILVVVVAVVFVGTTVIPRMWERLRRRRSDSET